MTIQAFYIGQTLTAAQMTDLQSNDFNQTVSTKTANYVLTAADKGTRIVMNVSSASTVTVNTSLFSAGDTLVIQNIASNATVVTAGTATVSTAGSLSIPQYGSGILFFISASAAIFFPSAGAASTSAVSQVKSTSLKTTFSVVSSLGVFDPVTGLTVSITPTSATNKVLLIATVNGTNASSSQGISAIFTGGNSADGRADAAGNRQRNVSATNSGGSSHHAGNMSMMYLDSPATTSPITYGISVNYVGTGSATDTVYINRSNGDTDFAYVSRTQSTITAIEVAP